MTSATLEQTHRVNYSRFVYVRGLAKTKSTQLSSCCRLASDLFCLLHCARELDSIAWAGNRSKTSLASCGEFEEI